MTDLSLLSTTPANNDRTGGFKTGMRPSSVKNAGWADEAIMAQLFNALPVGAGTSAALTLTNPVPLTTLTDGLTVFMLPGVANGPGATFSPDGLTAEPIFANGLAVAGGEMQTAVPALLKYRLAVTAWELVNPQPAGKNFFVDPCCRVGQSTVPSITISYQYGFVDLVQCKATGTAVNAGGITQDQSKTIAAAATAYSCKIASATITGTGKVFFRRWIESRDATAFTGLAGLFSVLCRQDTGGSINAFLTVNSFQSADSPGTPVQIATGSASPVSIPTATDTLVTLAIPNMSVAGAVANGFEVILEMDCGAVTTKNFYATDWQACIGTLAQRCVVPRFDDDLLAVQRYFEKSYEYGTAAGAVTSTGIIMGTTYNAANTSTIWLTQPFRVPKLVTPTMTLYSIAGTSGKITNGSIDAAITAAGALSGFAVTNNTGGQITSANQWKLHFTADARL